LDFRISSELEAPDRQPGVEQEVVEVCGIDEEQREIEKAKRQKPGQPLIK
jgi:hypothetical protein